LHLINKSECRFIGVLAKLHGYKGEYILASDVPLDEEIENWESVFLEIDGLLVPFFIDSLKITSDTSALIGFTDIKSPGPAKEFVSHSVFQLEKLSGVSEDYNEFKQLSGYAIIDKEKGPIGQIDRILDYNQNFLFRVLKGKREILIPVNENIIIKINHKTKEVIIAAPKGLLDL
jgi:16S rRNA processing protein RimM